MTAPNDRTKMIELLKERKGKWVTVGLNGEGLNALVIAVEKEVVRMTPHKQPEMSARIAAIVYIQPSEPPKEAKRHKTTQFPY